MPNAKGKTVDTTYLSPGAMETRKIFHRDYLAHVLRWSHVVRLLKGPCPYGPAWRVLDVGAGPGLPLLRCLVDDYYPLSFDRYTAVDYRPTLKVPEWWRPERFAKKLELTLLPKTDAAKLTRAQAREPNLVVCFEMLEHVELAHGRRVLRALRKVVPPGQGRLLLSTPVFSGQAAKNHVHEYGYEELEKELVAAGFTPERSYGTFAQRRKVERELQARYPDFFATVWPVLVEYHASELLAQLLAPAFPTKASNCLWVLS